MLIRGLVPLLAVVLGTHGSAVHALRILDDAASTERTALSRDGEGDTAKVALAPAPLRGKMAVVSERDPRFYDYLQRRLALAMRAQNYIRLMKTRMSKLLQMYQDDPSFASIDSPQENDAILKRLDVLQAKMRRAACLKDSQCRKCHQMAAQLLQSTESILAKIKRRNLAFREHMQKWIATHEGRNAQASAVAGSGAGAEAAGQLKAWYEKRLAAMERHSRTNFERIFTAIRDHEEAIERRLEGRIEALQKRTFRFGEHGEGAALKALAAKQHFLVLQNADFNRRIERLTALLTEKMLPFQQAEEAVHKVQTDQHREINEGIKTLAKLLAKKMRTPSAKVASVASEKELHEKLDSMMKLIKETAASRGPSSGPDGGSIGAAVAKKVDAMMRLLAGRSAGASVEPHGAAKAAVHIDEEARKRLEGLISTLNERIEALSKAPQGAPVVGESSALALKLDEISKFISKGAVGDGKEQAHSMLDQINKVINNEVLPITKKLLISSQEGLKSMAELKVNAAECCRPKVVGRIVRTRIVKEAASPKDASAIASVSVNVGDAKVPAAAAKDIAAIRVGETKEAATVNVRETKDAVAVRVGETKDAAAVRVSEAKDAVAAKVSEAKDAVAAKADGAEAKVAAQVDNEHNNVKGKVEHVAKVNIRAPNPVAVKAEPVAASPESNPRIVARPSSNDISSKVTSSKKVEDASPSIVPPSEIVRPVGAPAVASPSPKAVVTNAADPITGGKAGCKCGKPIKVVRFEKSPCGCGPMVKVVKFVKPKCNCPAKTKKAALCPCASPAAGSIICKKVCKKRFYYKMVAVPPKKGQCQCPRKRIVVKHKLICKRVCTKAGPVEGTVSQAKETIKKLVHACMAKKVARNKEIIGKIEALNGVQRQMNASQEAAAVVAKKDDKKSDELSFFN